MLPAAMTAPAPRSRPLAYGWRFTPDVPEFRQAEHGGPATIFGHFARFNEWARIESLFEGDFMERIQPGAFAKTIAEGKDRMRMLFNHGRDITGKQPIAKIEDVREDDQGAAYEATLLDGVPDLILSGLRAGQFGASFQFRSVRDAWNDHPKASATNPDGVPERTMTEVAVPEFGPVTFPAYAGATAAVRSMSDELLMAELASADPARRDAILQMVTRSAPAADAAATVGTSAPRAAPRERRFRSDADWLAYLEEQRRESWLS